MIGAKISSAPEKETRAFPGDVGSGTSADVGVGVSLALGAARIGTLDGPDDVEAGVRLG